MMIGKWATVVGLSMTPALIAGQSAAIGAGIAFGFDVKVMLPVVAFASFVEGVIVAWLAGQTAKIGFVGRWIEKKRTPGAMVFAKKWGVWGAMIFGVAVLGQEPILFALRALGVSVKRLVLPLIVSNVIFTLMYYAMIRFGIEQFLKHAAEFKLPQ